MTGLSIIDRIIDQFLGKLKEDNICNDVEILDLERALKSDKLKQENVETVLIKEDNNEDSRS